MKAVWVQIKNILKDNIFLRFIRRIYLNIVGLLSLHKGIPRFFAHGIIHLALLAILGTAAIFMIKYLFNSYESSFNQIVYTFYGDTLHNYRLNYLAFEKDMRRRPDDTYNENDIIIKYGYEIDSTKEELSVINPFKSKKIKDSCDLVSKVRYYKRNTIEDTLNTEINNNYKYLSLSKQYQKIDKVSNHDRYYYFISTLKDSSHVFHQSTNAKDRVIEWGSLAPYFSFWIGIIMDDKIELNSKSYVKIRFNDIGDKKSEEGIGNPLLIERVSPEPTKSDLNEIVYEGEELKAVIKQQGIYITGVDPIKKEEKDRKTLYITVYLGTIFAIMFDIIVRLVVKWIRLRQENMHSFSNKNH